MKDSFFGESKSKSEIAIQTETSSRLKLTSRKRIRFQKDNNPLDEENEEDSDNHNKNREPYKKDWTQSIVYKKAMKSEAIKRGLPYEKFEKYDLESDEDQYDLTTYHNET